MDLNTLVPRGLVLLGCGQMGSALLRGWLDGGLSPDRVHVRDPKPGDGLKASGVRVNGDLPSRPTAVLLAVKPQMMGTALPDIAALGGGPTLFVSIAAGTRIGTLEAALGGPATPVVRTMPNTPAMVGRGITAIVANASAGAAGLTLAEALMAAVGRVVRLTDEAEIDAVTAVSGSGPAYVFHLIEALAAAGVTAGLSAEVAMELARATVTGAGELAFRATDSAETLRRNVTSPAGTTEAALRVLMAEGVGLTDLMTRAVAAAAARGRELGA